MGAAIMCLQEENIRSQGKKKLNPKLSLPSKFYKNQTQR